MVNASQDREFDKKLPEGISCCSVMSTPSSLQGQHHLTQHNCLMKQSLGHRALHYHSTAVHNTVFQTLHPTNTPGIGSRGPDHPERGWEDIPLTTRNWGLIPPPPNPQGGWVGDTTLGGRGAIVTPRIYPYPVPVVITNGVD